MKGWEYPRHSTLKCFFGALRCPNTPMLAWSLLLYIALITCQLFDALQASMSGITVSEDAVNLYYYMKAKSAVRL